MKNNSLKIISAVMFAIIIVFLGSMNSFAADNPSYCHDQADGKFVFNVAPRITIEGGGTVDLGGVCPGCHKNWTCCAGDQPALFFTAHGSVDCYFQLTPSWSGLVNQQGQEADYNHIWIQANIYFNNMTGTSQVPWGNWMAWPPQQGQHQVPGHQGLYYFYTDQNGGGIFQWGWFICDVYADCYAAPGVYSQTVTMSVNYACAQ